MKKFKVNGKEYKARPFDFNLVCEMEDMGVALAEMGRKQFATTRAYFALCAGMNVVQAGKEMEAHAIAGGTFTAITDALSEEMEKSDFFRTLTKAAEEEVAENPDEAEQEEE